MATRRQRKLLTAATKTIEKMDTVAAEDLMRKLNIGFIQACELLRWLHSTGRIKDPLPGSQAYQVNKTSR